MLYRIMLGIYAGLCTRTLVGRRRVKEQLKKIGGIEFYQVHFSYIDLETNEEKFIGVPESGGNTLIPEGNLSPGSLYTIATSTSGGQKGLFKIDVQIMPGSGKFSDTGFGTGTAIKEEMKEAINYLKANLSKISPNLKYSEFDFHIKATDMNGIGNISGMELAIFISLVSSILDKPILSQSVILGSMSIGGTVIGTQNLGDSLQVASDSGAKKVLIPVLDIVHMATVPPDLFSKFNLIIYTDPINSVFKALGVE